ncbi:DUF1566 domain-containing protein [Telmatospirillum sp.]|uniref:Lcl domain-containing protein n=1 Tax=Telmatospirillum sp. TaxID=2079197 RepID=UPI0028432D27|nr:DUF1566 domain-containing protein [Telmatospirillum sp.]MDR3438991.1 DUF1566 domain-containing protein [Telmatospirillum sp.]
MTQSNLAMKRPEPVVPALGEAFGGGIVGNITPWAGGRQAIVIVADKTAGGDLGEFAWDPDYDDAPGAKSFTDGLANTDAINDGQHPAAQAARAYRGGGFDDWQLPALAEHLGLLANLCPIWTEMPAFKTGGEQAYEEAPYWTSTQSQFYQLYAWTQHFGSGLSDYWSKGNDYRVRPVRIVLI